MKKVPPRLFIFAIVLILIFSCSAEETNSLCRIGINFEKGRSFNTVISLSLSDNIYVKADTHHRSDYTYLYISDDVKTIDGDEYRKLDTSIGLLLSQGIWDFRCVWFADDNSTIIARGQALNCPINLSTQNIRIILDSDDFSSLDTSSGSLSFTYDVPGDTSTLTLFAEILGYDNPAYLKIFSPQIGETYNINDFTSGRYILKVEVRDASQKGATRFTDILGFVIRNGFVTTVSGMAGELNNLDNTSIYIPWEPDPVNPDPGNGNVIQAGNNGTNKPLNNVTDIDDNTIYIVNPDSNNGSDMALGHVGGNRKNNHILTPDTSDGPVNFAVDMKGVDVGITAEYAPFQGGAENTTIIDLPTDATMSIFNSGNRNAIWGERTSSGLLGRARHNTNINISGGTLNVIGPDAIDDISNAAIIIQGPTKDETWSGASTVFGSKQGALNFSGTGGTVTLDGNVYLKGQFGITSFGTDNKGTLSDSFSANITLKNGAAIEAEADNNLDCYGINLMGSNKDACPILIELDDSHITTTNQKSDKQAGVYISNYGGFATIVLKGDSYISSSGNGIFLENCSNVDIVVMDGSYITGGLYAIKLTNCSNITLNGNPLTASVSGTVTSSSNT